jgi:predicted AAA+ superfamily ATPase
MDELQQILEKAKLTAERIEDNLKHTFLQTKLKPREVFSEIKETVDTYFTTGNGIRALGYAGLRGTGKTTLLWQAAEHIYKNYTENIYFFDFSNLIRQDISVWDIKDAFEKYIVKNYLASYKEKIVLIFDEVHESPMWAKALKSLYDEFRIAFILTSGSSALLLQSTADLVTRMLIQHVYPLNFREYIGFTQQKPQTIGNITKEKLQKAIFFSKNAEILFNKLQNIKPVLDDYVNKTDNLKKHIYDYIVYRNIIRFLLIDSELKINKQIQDLVRRVIYEDIPKIAEIANPRNAEKILNRLAASDEINIQSLSQSTGISQDRINESLNILEKAELLNVLYPYGGIDSKINKAKKYFFMSPSIRKAILTPFTETNTDSIYAKMLEDTIILYLKRIFRDDNFLSFSSAKGQKNPDLIIETLPEPILLEIGINKNTTKQISESRIKYKYGIIINSKTDEIKLHNDIVIIPLKYFLLL